MKRYFNFIFLLTVIGLEASGQANFQDAMVVIKAGDTLKGKVDYRH